MTLPGLPHPSARRIHPRPAATATEPNSPIASPSVKCSGSERRCPQPVGLRDTFTAFVTTALARGGEVMQDAYFHVWSVLIVGDTVGCGLPREFSEGCVV
ncbi:hypothetical protein P152DRAFT_456461 [Eremomyces bilateralis CBS 781.70]|uniref:Uncharacterized protein n=1 Tax=Eremomyces bilateralis CBS 781.70 TaxID=1392243 RepID=A0A6G1G881_9PEZI|nr:uncharacterized protein P152DRAFT_456461 [Eremomyces bilateralis CBS 781.70]KAF1814233.1 hypothetical protein P152DRAFT_456461 [Eremomyces bilateralis CBS 781.70]